MSSNTLFLPGSYNQTSQYTQTSSSKSNQATVIINAFFAGQNILCGQAVISVAADSVKIHVPYFIFEVQNALGAIAVINLHKALIRLYGITVVLRLVRLTVPYLDAHVLAKYISAELVSNTFTQVVRRLFALISPVTVRTNLQLPAFLVGFKIRLAGRLIKEKSHPRLTVQTVSLGNLAVSRTNITHSAGYTSVNIKGSYTVKV